jgi:hypothetical protein
MATAKIPTSKFLAKGGAGASASMPGGMSAGKVSLKSPVNKNMPTAKRPPAGATVGSVPSKAKVNLASKASPGMPVSKKEAMSSGGKRSSMGVKSR